jgi:threonine dehydratase
MEFSRFRDARALLSRYLPKTRLVRAASLESSPPRQVFLKLENELPTSSFKVRGAIYALSLREQAQGMREVVASSTGNHGAAVAYAAKLLGWRARIFLPAKNNPIKRNNITRLGAAIEERGTIDLAGAFRAASEYAQKSGPRSAGGSRNHCVRDIRTTAECGRDLRAHGRYGFDSRCGGRRETNFRES